MSFANLIPVQKVVRERNGGVAASLQKLGGSPAKLHLTFKAVLLQELRWRYDDRFAVLLGQREDLGRIRLRADPDGSAVLVRRQIRWDHDFGDINLGIVSVFPDRKEASANCRLLRLPEGWVEIVLPRWGHAGGGARRGPGRPPKASTDTTSPSETSEALP
ncbi:hypothetical protein [Pelagibacterium montanilacus]|uniref:hypothetical protein n=1 Tax=Pelagibacterium montanilacus TaxID=2185280 RepID=UPI000F8DF877|nr:hypothetical protein [Pelagibacterium montanilacus]